MTFLAALSKKFKYYSHTLNIVKVQLDGWKAFCNKMDADNNIEKVLTKVAINPSYLKQYPQLANLKAGDLESSVKLMRDLHLSEDAVVEMSVKTPSLVWKCYKVCQKDLKKSGEHRIKFLSKKLNVTEQTFCSKLSKYKFVLSLSMDRIKNTMKVLEESNVEAADILSDFWILRCKGESVALRLNQVKEAEIEVVKPWMGRCKNTVFEGFLTRAASKHKMLGDFSLEEYISRRLGCSPAQIQDIINREPQLQRASVFKIKKILDFLFASGFTAHQILAGLPRVANRRIETINARLQELNQLCVAPSLYVLCKSKREYQYYVNKRKKIEK